MIAVDTSALMASSSAPEASGLIMVIEAAADLWCPRAPWLKPLSLPAAGVSPK